MNELYWIELLVLDSNTWKLLLGIIINTEYDYLY